MAKQRNLVLTGAMGAFTALVIVASLSGCGKEVDAVVVVPHTDTSGKDWVLGERRVVETGRFYEANDALIARLDSERVTVSPEVAKIPLPTRTLFVISTVATLHDDKDAQDRGRRLLPFGQKITVATSEIRTRPGVHLLIEEGLPVGFVRAKDVRATQSTSAEMMAVAKAALLERNFGQARHFSESALRTDSTSISARRLVGALRNRDGEAEGWRLWASARPKPPRAVDLPPHAAVKGPGRVFLVATDVSLRKGPSKRTARLALLSAGTAFDVVEVKKGWAKVRLLRKGGEMWRASVDQTELVDDAAPWENTTVFTPSQREGFIAQSLLSTDTPDADAMVELAKARIANKRFGDAIVPLTRALAMRSNDDELRGVLFTTAVHAEQYILALSVFDKRSRGQPTKEPTEGALSFTVERISGCHGDRSLARTNVISNKNVVSKPLFFLDDMSAGVLNAAAVGENGCVVDDQPGEPETYTAEVFNIDTYFGGGCGFEPDFKIGPDEEKEYELWAKKRQAEIDVNKQVHNRYLAAFSAWKKKRSALLSGPSVRFQITASKERPAGTAIVYSFNWHVDSWCGDIHSATRKNVVAKRLRLPRMQAGQTLELWLENVDVTAEWGLMIDDSQASHSEAYFKDVAKGPKNGSVSDRNFLDLPKNYADVAVETLPGTSMDHSDECCAC